MKINFHDCYENVHLNIDDFTFFCGLCSWAWFACMTNWRKKLADSFVKNLRVDGNRLWDSLMKLSEVGPGIAGGNNRQTLTDSDSDARQNSR